MATRSHVIIDGISLYSHWDGYPIGMVAKLYAAIEKLHYAQKNDWHTEKVPFLNAFIAGNIKNCELDLKRSIGGIEYYYRIDSSSMRINAYKIHHDDSEELIFSGSIFDFVKRYHVASSDGSSCFDARDALYLVTQKEAYGDGVLVDYYTQKTYTQELHIQRKNVKRFDVQNTNQRLAKEAIQNLKDAQVIKGADHATR